MRIYIAHSFSLSDEAIELCAWLESKDNSVYLPIRDTPQETAMVRNREAIRQADEVYVIYDGKSAGTLLDVGIAFAYEKKVRIVQISFGTKSRVVEFLKQLENDTA